MADLFDIVVARKLSGGGGGTTVEALSVTQNGTYTAPSGKAYSPVTVNVSGGSSDFSTAECTIVAPSPISIIAPCITPNGINGNIFSEDITDKLTVILYQDNSTVWSPDADVVSVSGNAEIDDGVALITGDCTITFE